MATKKYAKWDDYPILMDTVMVAQLLGCDETKVRKMANNRVIPAYRIGKELRYDRDEIKAYVYANRVQEKAHVQKT